MAKGYSIHSRSGSWYVRVRYKGINVNNTFQRKSPGDVWAREQVRLIDDGKFKKNSEISDHRNYTLAEALQEYIDDYPTRTKKEENRQKDYKYVLSTIKRHKISKLTLSEIDTSHLLGFIRERRQQGIADQTIKNNLNCI